MSRKVFLSFVGLSEYITCNYYFNGDENDLCDSTRFIQEAIIRHECRDWNENDEYYFFATAAAKDNNWNDGKFKFDDENAGFKKGDPKIGLKKILFDKFNIENPKLVSINDGTSEKDIWEIFDKINACIQQEDEVYLDITHAFRSLPMLGIVILNYLKATKNITIGEIYYGAFEKLGSRETVLEKEVEDRKAPVLKLRSFNDIMNFSFAAKLFEDYGNADLLCKSIKESWANPKTVFEQKLRSCLSNNLNEISTDLQTCRGGKICDANSFKQLSDTFKSLENISASEPENINYKALGPILQNIQKKFCAFSTEKDLNNGFVAAQWCFDHGMYQQSATMLQETFVSYCTSKVLPYDVDSECQTFEARECRKLIEDYLKYDPKRPNSSEEWKDDLDALVKEQASFNKTDIEQRLEKLSGFRSEFNSLTTTRNNLNHAGFVVKGELNKVSSENQKAASADSIKNSVKEALKKFENLKERLAADGI